MKKKKIRVAIIENQPGWGDRLQEIKVFNTIKQAVSFAARYNTELPAITFENRTIRAELMQ